jgi:transcriptional regulator with XRE-family HTH domain
MELIKDAVNKTSQSAVARETGLTQSAVGRYYKGIGEPTSATLEKLGAYFGVSAACLRGGTGVTTPARIVELVGNAISEKGRDTVESELGLRTVTVELLLEGKAEPNDETCEKISDYFNIPVSALRGDLITSNYAFLQLSRILLAVDGLREKSAAEAPEYEQIETACIELLCAMGNTTDSVLTSLGPEYVARYARFVGKA